MHSPDRRKNSLDQSRLLALAADVGRALTTGQSLSDMLHGCAEALVGHLDAAFARVWTLDEAGDTLVLRASAGLYTHLNGPHGRVPVGRFKIGLIAQERAPHLTNAVIGDPRVSDQDWAVREGMVAFAGYPLLVEDRLVGVVALFARHTLPEETLQALASVADQIAVGIGRKSAEEEAREALRRMEGILSSITDAFFALDAEWRFTYLNAQAEGLLQHPRAGLLGRSVWEALPDAVGTRFERQYRRAVDEQAPVTFEEYYPPLDAWFEVRAYPAPDGLSVFFQNVSVRKALEAQRERLAERERNIAQQLQAALTPSVPSSVPGLKLSKYYEAALDEAGVGGDFYDVFAVEKGCTALVVGDLSGKGLQAAAQVSIVRNMLRAFLYSQPTVAAAVTDLNRVLAENNLLAGFSTLFVGAFDSGTRELKYVNCGQEPALLRRGATGAVEQLLPTGLILGTVENARYTEETVALLPGDAIALFSDGLTEVGPTRAAMLGIEGVTSLFAQPVGGEDARDAAGMAEQLVLRLIAGVDASAAGGVMRDDVCLLVGVVE